MKESNSLPLSFKKDKRISADCPKRPKSYSLEDGTKIPAGPLLRLFFFILVKYSLRL